MERANFYARAATSAEILELIGRKAGLSPTEIDATGPYNPDTERLLREPTAERRALQLSRERQEYRLRFDTETNQDVPIVLIYALAPTVPAATKLADAAASGLRTYVQRIQVEQGLKRGASVRLRQLGAADGAVVNPGADRQIAVLVFSAALLAWSVLVLLAANLRRILAHHIQRLGAPRPKASLAQVDLADAGVDNPHVRSSR